MDATGKKRILVAVRLRAHQTMLAALGGQFNITLCGSLAEAKSALHQDFDLVACGMNFDESRMFDLLRYIKSTPPIQGIPFLGMKVAEGVLEPSIFYGVAKAAKALGAADFIDFAQWRMDFGDQQAFQMLRDAIGRLC